MRAWAWGPRPGSSMTARCTSAGTPARWATSPASARCAASGQSPVALVNASAVAENASLVAASSVSKAHASSERQ